MTDYLLLTGATGLLGSYLLRDSLLAGRRVAVLVRPRKSESARQRIETILAHWEQHNGNPLPRPVVLPGDLLRPDLGLDAQGLRWVADHCGSVIHNAASLAFYHVVRDGEPWRSNVGGTRRVLELCHRVGIRQFHHVSTAYVCGLRRGRILESDLDVGQQCGNDYERSKLEAEKMVRADDGIDPPTVYRPAIIVGDSRNGYTTTYHGFYAPLKLAHTMVSKVVRGSTAGRLLVKALGLTGNEQKNFVPVDWVSAVITHIHGSPELHHATYHLAPRRPVPISEMAGVMHEAVESYSNMGNPSDQWICDGVWFKETFRARMDMYRAYWRDDPEFDRTNTIRAAAHLPCPEIDRQFMLRLARFAIQSGFGRPRQRPIRPDFDVHHQLRALVRAHDRIPRDLAGRGRLGLEVDGPGGGQWELILEEEQVVAATEGVDNTYSGRVRLDSKTYEELVKFRLSVAEAVHAGRIRIHPNGMPPGQVEAILGAAVPSLAACDCSTRASSK